MQLYKGLFNRNNLALGALDITQNYKKTMAFKKAYGKELKKDQEARVSIIRFLVKSVPEV